MRTLLVTVMLSLLLFTSLAFPQQPPAKTQEFISPNVANSLDLESQAQYSLDEIVPIGSKAMLQGFYLDVPDNGQWWNLLANRSSEFAAAGFDAIWAPPPTKTDLNSISTWGYEPYDYYDLGEYNQKERIRTRYGTRAELQNFISMANSHGIGVVADVVLNHNRGGESEFNPFVQDFTPTNFENIASGQFPRNYTHFWPNDYGTEDRYAYLNFPDLSHSHPYVYEQFIEWGKWLRDEIGFDGWRFDVAHGVNETLQRDWMREVGGWGVGEYWYGTFQDMLDYLDATEGELSAFDFFLLYELQKMVDGEGARNLRYLATEGLAWNNRLENAVVFGMNHDTVKDENVKITQDLDLVYAYLLTHQAYPSVFWEDYFDPQLQPIIQALLEIRAIYGAGENKILSINSDIYVMERQGDPGLIFGLNDNPDYPRTADILTKWRDVELSNLLSQEDSLVVDSTGSATITVPPQSFVVYGEGNAIGDVFQYVDADEIPVPDMIAEGQSLIDGRMGYDWPSPLFVDDREDGGTQFSDVYAVYLMHDDQDLYLGLGYGAHAPFQSSHQNESFEFGIALSTQTGGAFEIPAPNNRIKFAKGNNPEYVITLTTDPTTFWNEVTKATLEKYNPKSEAWNDPTLLSEDSFASDPLQGFVELKIPLSELHITGSQDIAIKVFTSRVNEAIAIDTMPDDVYLGSEDQYLEMSATIPIHVAESDGEGKTTKNSLEISLPSTLLILILVPLHRRIRKYYS